MIENPRKWLVIAVSVSVGILTALSSGVSSQIAQYAVPMLSLVALGVFVFVYKLPPYALLGAAAGILLFFFIKQMRWAQDMPLWAECGVVLGVWLGLFLVFRRARR
jgi:hypothetical protein